MHRLKGIGRNHIVPGGGAEQIISSIVNNDARLRVLEDIVVVVRPLIRRQHRGRFDLHNIERVHRIASERAEAHACAEPDVHHPLGIGMKQHGQMTHHTLKHHASRRGIGLHLAVADVEQLLRLGLRHGNRGQQAFLEQEDLLRGEDFIQHDLSVLHILPRREIGAGNQQFRVQLRRERGKESGEDKRGNPYGCAEKMPFAHQEHQRRAAGQGKSGQKHQRSGNPEKTEQHKARRQRTENGTNGVAGVDPAHDACGFMAFAAGHAGRQREHEPEQNRWDQKVKQRDHELGGDHGGPGEPVAHQVLQQEQRLRVETGHGPEGIAPDAQQAEAEQKHGPASAVNQPAEDERSGGESEQENGKHGAERIGGGSENQNQCPEPDHLERERKKTRKGCRQQADPSRREGGCGRAVCRGLKGSLFRGREFRGEAEGRESDSDIAGHGKKVGSAKTPCGDEEKTAGQKAGDGAQRVQSVEQAEA